MEAKLIDLPDPLITDRLLLRAPREGEAADINRGANESIAELKLWMPWAQEPQTMEQTVQYSRRSHARHLMREEIAFRLYLREGGAFAGNMSLFNIDWTVRRFEIGYWLHTALTGQGYMTEAVVAATAFAFDQLSARRVEIRTDDRNERSCRVAERAGFLLEGIMRCDALDPTGEPRDTRVYATTIRSR